LQAAEKHAQRATEALIHSMRLSLVKGAHAYLSCTAWQESGVKPAFGLSGMSERQTVVAKSIGPMAFLGRSLNTPDLDEPTKGNGQGSRIPLKPKNGLNGALTIGCRVEPLLTAHPA